MGVPAVIRPWQVNQATTATPASPALQSTSGLFSLNQTPDQTGFIKGDTIASDPYAQYGGQGAYNNLVSGFGTQKQNIFGSSMDAAKNAGFGLKSNILDFVDSLRSGQRSIDNAAINNELTKQRGTADVYGTVSRGIQSGGVTLANRNAADSSASEAIAKAYGGVGRRGLSQVNNQYALDSRDLALDQQTLDEQRASGSRKLGESKQQVVGTIVAQARSSLAALDAAMTNASLPDRIAIEQEKENIRQQVLGELAQYDQLLASESATITPSSQEARMSEATRLRGAGQVPAGAFDFQTGAPAEFQDTGPFASPLPLFTLNRRRTA